MGSFPSFIVCFISASILSSCYSINVGFTYLGLLLKADNIEKLQRNLAAENEEERIFFKKVASIKEFSEQKLGLKATKNYSTYVELDRDFLTWVISASPKYKLENYEWKYPFVGRLPYRGFFNLDKLRKELKKLKKLDLDIYVRRVDAFSTLGYFRDPLFSYMKSYSDFELANLIIHESVHSTIFIKNSINFNESLAEFIASRGAELYLLSHGEDRAAKLKEQRLASKKDSLVFRKLLFELKDKLNALYNSSTDPGHILASAKAELISKFKTNISNNYDELFLSANYKNINDFNINNAFINLYALYYEEKDSDFERLYASFAGDLLAMVNFIKSSYRQERKGLPQYLKTYVDELDR